MTPQDALALLLLGLQFLYANEGRDGGTEAALVLGEALGRLTDQPILTDRTMPPVDGLAPGAHPLAAAIHAAGPLIPWYHAGLDDGKIPEAVARRMLTAELVGPEGLIHDTRARIGLFWQGAGVDYPVRTHAAEETYLVLAGEGGWSLDHAAHTLHGPGAVIFHPSFAPHASRTDTRPMLAAWRWGGEIGWESYKIA
ncbi:dimethylsulfonioproprionate lyase family protein [Acidimangrovimonas sediminis]|uniref:dimethylsulfonioproprionate lyase family protein n=1 Tax=Acidimangrovimonas sediminis TaxID=2056283 RepID=UPI000C80195E|nr:dimethylsulfonioproprionate lyase family protein [Acidimangrovimonas sediminis]